MRTEYVECNCVQRTNIQNLKAIHNGKVVESRAYQLCSKNEYTKSESNSQLPKSSITVFFYCVQRTMLGVSQGLVSRWEKGDANFTLSTIVAIASVLGLELQSTIQPSPIKHYRVGGSNIYQFNPSIWHSASFSKDMTTVTSVEADTELKEM